MKPRIWVVLVCLLLAPPVFADELLGLRIVAVEFVGNEVTQPQVMLREMTLGVGDPVDWSRIEESRQAIMDLGLFKSVRSRVERLDEGAVLRIEVDEKYYVLPVPLLGGQPEGAYEYGLELQLSNIGGMNRRLSLIGKVQEHGVEALDDPNRNVTVRYFDPRAFGRNYQLFLNARLDRQQHLLADSHYASNNQEFNVSLAQWLNPEARSRGWRAEIGLYHRRLEYQRLTGDALVLQQGLASAFTAALSFHDVHNYGYSRVGSTYGWAIALSAPAPLSDYAYWRNVFFIRHYQPLNRGANLNWRLQIGFAGGDYYGAPAYSLGGAYSLRGHPAAAYRGNSVLLSNLEYLFPIWAQHPQFRGVLFADIGNAYPGVLEIEPGEQNLGLGIGFRWEVQSLVNVAVSADIGIDPASRGYELYLRTGATF